MSIQYILEMPSINIIDCKIKGSTVAFLLIPVIFSKTSAIKNMSIFKDLVIRQINLIKEDFYWAKLHIL